MILCPLCNTNPIHESIVEWIEGTVCEREYICLKCGTVGYWAYGSFDPSLPYTGEKDGL
jgi:hypothetical protein